MTVFPNVLALDLSITATGLTHTVEGAACTHTIKTRQKGDDRLAELADHVGWYIEKDRPELVLIEGYLNKSMSAGITGMVHGAVRLKVVQLGLGYAVLPPSSLKKFATGKGNATKTDMAVAAVKRAGLEFADDNACDSWWLWLAGLEHLGYSALPLPQGQRDALSKIVIEVEV